MPYSLKGRNVLVTGGSRGLGALIAQKFASEGSNVAINYVSNTKAAEDTASELGKEYKVKTSTVQGDQGIDADCVRMINETIKVLGGLDVVISNAGWTKFSEFGDLYSMDEESWDKCWAVNVKGNLHLCREAMKTFNKNAEGGVFLISSSVAGIAQSGSSMPYSVTKAAQLHLMKCMAATQGPKLRINAVLPGLLLTDWGNLYGEDRINAIRDRAALKKETLLDDCADAYIAAAKNSSMTGTHIQVDSGLMIK